ncbi:hypothetical protein RMATCC62417_11437 [Rhizopus microsporus]|nr:hypothetical protein RMATCC62417_11437 [Rhizopus microsporus]
MMSKKKTLFVQVATKKDKNTKSPLYPNRKLTKQEELQQLMENRKTTTVKAKLETILRPAHRNIKDKIIKVSKDIRNILIRVQLFVNYYIMNHNGLVVDKKVFTQNFWYSISQLALGKTPTNKKSLPDDIFSNWKSFSSRYKEIVYKMDSSVAGYSQCLTATCVEVATCYNNMTVECFQSRLMSYLSNSKHVQKLAEYGYQYICDGQTTWPEDVTDITIDERTAINSPCKGLSRTEIPKPVTVKCLAASPGSYIPMLREILKRCMAENQKQQENQEYGQQEKPSYMARLFSLFPVPSLKWRSVSINPNTLSSFAGKPKQSNYDDKFNMFNTVFDLSSLGVNSFEDLKKPAAKNKTAFANLIRSDGFAANVALYKGASNNEDVTEQSSDSTFDIQLLSDVLKPGDVDNFSLCGLDPGRQHAFTASYNEGENPHQIRRVSTAEYYNYTGSIHHQRKEQKRMEKKGMKNVLLNIPSIKTTSLMQYHMYMTYIMANIQKILDFYGYETAEGRFHCYQGVQRAIEEMVNILINGGKKYNKDRRKNTRKNRRRRKKKKEKRGKGEKKKDEESSERPEKQ